MTIETWNTKNGKVTLNDESKLGLTVRVNGKLSAFAITSTEKAMEEVNKAAGENVWTK